MYVIYIANTKSSHSAESFLYASRSLGSQAKDIEFQACFIVSCFASVFEKKASFTTIPFAEQILKL